MSKNVQDEFTLKNKKMQFGRLMSYFKPYLHLLALSVFLAFIVNAAVLAKPYIIKLVIDNELAKGNSDIHRISMMGVLYFVIIVIGSCTGYFQAYILNYVGQNIMHNIRLQVFSHIQHMSMGFFDKNSSGRILTRITNDVEALNELYSGVMINIFRDAVMILGIIALMVYMNIQLALISISCVPLIMLVMYFYKKAARKNFIRMKGLIARINAFLAENISGMKLVQIFHREKEKFDELKKLDEEYYKAGLREIILNSLGRPIVDIINNLTIAVLIWFCTGRVIGDVLEIGVLYAFITYIKQFFDPIAEISEKYTSIQSAVVSSERIFEILDNVEPLEDMESGLEVEKLTGEIEFRNVWFAYDDENWVLKDVSFKINPGEVIAFVGATGSGKSTIINLVARFYDIQKGEILIDGINIKDYNLRSLRRQIAVVLQDVFLFSGDIKSNIRLKNNDISEENVRLAAEFVRADKFIESLENKYEEEVKERGCTFSAGQKQLISFARAVAFNPSILVLDEATANIDTETEIAIQEAMKKISSGRTSIIIAHRLSTIRNADKIVVIHRGKIREMGRHEELMEKKGLYNQLYMTQLAREAAAEDSSVVSACM